MAKIQLNGRKISVKQKLSITGLLTKYKIDLNYNNCISLNCNYVIRYINK